MTIVGLVKAVMKGSVIEWDDNNLSMLYIQKVLINKKLLNLDKFG